jgi:opacity protein-like surface antigen
MGRAASSYKLALRFESTTRPSDTLGAKRVDYAQDNWLFYGTVGVELTNDKAAIVTSTFVCNTENITCSSKADWQAGLAAGAGIEYGLTPNLSTKLEYLWVRAGASNTFVRKHVARRSYRFGG